MNKKTKIIDSTIKLLKTIGYNDLSVQKICTQAGIAKGSFYTYFSQKTDVIDEIIAHLIGEVVNQLKKLSTNNELEDKLEKIIDIIYQYIEKENILIRETFEAYVINNRMNKWAFVYDEFYKVLEDLLFQYKDEKTIMLTQIVASMIENSAEKTFIFNHYNEKEMRLRKSLVFQSSLIIIKSNS